MQKTKRQGNFDVLKIIAIFFIVLHHYALWSGWKFEPGFHLNKLAAQSLIIGGKLGVNLFVMITGYFMIKSFPKMKSIMTIWVETTVISLFIYLITVRFHLGEQFFDLETFIRRLFPVIFGQYWFVTAYSLLYLAIPLLNKVLLSANLIKFKRGLLIGFIVLSLSTYIYYRKGLTFSYPIWLAYLYSIGAYLRLNKITISTFKLWKSFLYISVIGFICLLSNIVLQFLFAKPDLLITKLLTFFGWHETIFYTSDSSPLMLILAVWIFIMFMNLEIKARKIYAYVGRAAFGVYLIHTAPWFGSNYLMPVLINADRYSSGKMIILYGILMGICIYIGSIVIYTCLLPVIKIIIRLLNRPTQLLQGFVFGKSNS